ncbi:hypothetical protein [Kitasatospora cathayae]|uniref:Uncharacterized protein n=1 Tax=Kitasatospora cathayae TaxID=3004092 RepID=A0ABY7PXF2_9ACTN|nr:hypothetical protein [Kitasatospora sp. HUAS 3-15]WBP85107.1 hypothetical protein O1G21_04070 [Kitasatospora sp. HUAS 3-15]
MHAARARRWFWALTATAVVSMGGLYRGLHTASAGARVLLVGAGFPVLVASAVQAARIWLTLTAGPRAPAAVAAMRARRRRAAPNRRSSV